jgi:histidinol-phosphate/aromatic aminotransferase/cobyric acid decarboxylase-like protein
VRLWPVGPVAHGGASPLPIDLSASLNPLGPPPAARAAAERARLERYPEAAAEALTEAAARRHRVPREAVVPVPGASWGLWLTLVSALEPGERCVGLGPCFGEYRRYAAIAGARYHEVTCPAPDQRWDAATLDAALGDAPEMCVLGNPANPAGTVVPASELRALCDEHFRTTLVVDEAFAGFAPAGSSLIDGELPPANAIVVRSLTKELALPGLRMGYLVAVPERAAQLRGVLPAWPLGAPAVAAAAAGCEDLRHLEAGAAVARKHMQEIAGGLRRRGLAPLETDVNYLVCAAPDLETELATRGVAVRDCGSLGLPGVIRIAAPRPSELADVLRAIDG